MVQQLRQAVADWDPSPEVVVVSRADPEQTEHFLARHWPGVAHVDDCDGRWARHYGVQRARWWHFFGPAPLWAALRAWLKGHRVTTYTRDIWQMPAYFLVDQQERVLWRYFPRHAGDHPKWSPAPWLEVTC